MSGEWVVEELQSRVGDYLTIEYCMEWDPSGTPATMHGTLLEVYIANSDYDRGARRSFIRLNRMFPDGDTVDELLYLNEIVDVA